MENIEKFLTAGDGLSLYYQSWDPGQPRRAVVCLVHGIGEHSNRYRHVAAHFNEAHIAMAAIDLRGHGKSGGPRGHTPSYQALMDDIGLLIAEAKLQFPGLPCFLYGHSLGSGLVLNYVLREKPEVVGVILSAPDLRLAFDPPLIKVLLGRIMNKVMPSYNQATGLDTSALSRSPDVVKQYENDPLVHDRISARLYMGFVEGGKWALAHADELEIPTLVIHGSADRVTSPQASREFAEKAGPICEYKSWEGFYHEVHNEIEQDKVLDYVLEWVENHLV